MTTPAEKLREAASKAQEIGQSSKDFAAKIKASKEQAEELARKEGEANAD